MGTQLFKYELRPHFYSLSCVPIFIPQNFTTKGTKDTKKKS